MNKLKLYKVRVPDEEDGIIRISLVEDPANEKHFSYYSKSNSNYNIVDEEKHLVFGLVIPASTRIFRNDPPIGEHYAEIEPTEVRKIVERYFKYDKTKEYNKHHNINLNVEGCYIVRSFFKDTANGINPVGYEDVPDGSWFIEVKVENDEVWTEIKNGEFKGFSPEYIYELEETNEYIDNQNLINMEKLTRVNLANRQRHYRKTVRANHSKVVSRYGTVMTSEGVQLSYDGYLELDQEPVYAYSDSDEGILANGVFTLQTEDERNGRIVTIDQGKVVSYTDPEGNNVTDTPSVNNEGSAAAEAQIESAEKSLEGIQSLADGISSEIGLAMQRLDDAMATIEANYSKTISYFSKIASNYETVISEQKEMVNTQSQKISDLITELNSSNERINPHNVSNGHRMTNEEFLNKYNMK